MLKIVVTLPSGATSVIDYLLALQCSSIRGEVTFGLSNAGIGICSPGKSFAK